MGDMKSETSADGFGGRLAAAVRKSGNPIVVGLDPRMANLPAPLRCEGEDRSAQAERFALFCREVIDVVAPLVGIVKPQAAFFERLGPAGMGALGDVIQYARKQGLLVIVDGKRNDIGSTATAYADAFLGQQSAWGGDALTVNPYLGTDSLEPFVQTCVERAAGIFVLVKTSNPGSGVFQDGLVAGRPVHQLVAETVERMAAATADQSGYGCVGAVVGATYPQQLAELRAVMPHAWLLVPGYGSQGGTAGDVVGAFDSQGQGAIINNSRGIIFAYERDDYKDRWDAGQWQRAVEQATRDMIAELQTVV